MFKLNKKTKVIHCTRGDHGGFNFNSPISNEDGQLKYLDADGNIYWYDSEENKLYDSVGQESNVELKTLTMELYEYTTADILRFKIMKANKCTDIVLSKDFTVDEPSTFVRIVLEKEDTKIGDVISKPVDYWYEIELNPDTTPKTLLCFDEAGAKIFKLYPEGDDVNVGS